MRSFWLVACVVVVSACPERHYAEFVPPAQRFMSAAAGGERASIEPLVSDSVPVLLASGIRVQRPGALQAASRSLRPTAGQVWGDSAYIVFSYELRDSVRLIELGFVRRADQWLVYYIGSPR